MNEQRIIEAKLDKNIKEKDKSTLNSYKNQKLEHLADLLEIYKYQNMDIELFLKKILEIVAKSYKTEFSSIYFFNDEQTELVCRLKYQKSTNSFISSNSISSKVYPNFFSMLYSSMGIIAKDVKENDVTSELWELLYKENLIKAVISIPIRHFGEVEGLISLEHIDEPREWLDEEHSFLIIIAEIIATAIEGNERRILEKELRRSEEKYRLLVEQLPIGVYRTNCNGNFLFANNQLVFMLGYDSFEELSTINVKELYYKKEVHDEQWKYLNDNLSYNCCEIQLIKKDGTIFWVFENGNPVYDGDGNLLYLDGTIQDITERKNVETEVKIQKAFFEKLFQEIPIAITLVDNNDRVIRINKMFTQLFGFSSNDINGRLLNDVIIPARLDYYTQAQKATEAVINGEFIKFEALRKRKDSSVFDCLIIGNPIKLDNEQLAIFGIYQDISERKLAEKEIFKAKEYAEEASKYKSIIMQNFGHELRTPLNGILISSKILLQSCADHENRELIENIIHSGRRLTDTLNTLYLLTEIELKGLKINTEEINLIEIIENVTNHYKSIIYSKGLKLEVNYNSQILTAYIDGFLLQNILMQIMDNAIKFTEKGVISIDLYSIQYESNVWFDISIKDTGIGIPENKKEQIFDAFHQGSSGLNRNFEGLGIGLTIARKIAELINCKIIVESNPSKGSVFRLLFSQH